MQINEKQGLNNFKNEDMYLFDVTYRYEYAKKVVDIVNKYMPEENKISDREVWSHVRSSKVTEQYYMTNKKQKEFDHAKNMAKNLPYGLAREGSYFTGTDKEINEKSEQLNDLNNAKQYIYESLVSMYEKDPMDYLSTDYNTMCDKFLKDPLAVNRSFILNSSLRDQGLQVNGDFGEHHANLEGFGQLINNSHNAFDYAKNPLSLIIPSKEGLNEVVMAQALPEIMKLGMELGDDAPGFMKDPNFATTIGEFAARVGEREENRKICTKLQEMQKNNTLPKNFMMKGVFQVEGKDVNAGSFKEAVKAGKNVGFREYSHDEQERLKESLYNNAIGYRTRENQIKANEVKLASAENGEPKLTDYFENLSKMSKDINKTNSVFSKDTDEFKKMRDSLNQFVKDYKEKTKQINELTKGMSKADAQKEKYAELQKFYKEKKKDLEVVKNNASAYQTMKEKKNKAEVEAGKKNSDRSINRFLYSRSLNLALEHDPDIYEKVPSQPFRNSKMKDTVNKEINASDKKNEKTMTKEVSKTKNLEATGPDLGKYCLNKTFKIYELNEKKFIF